VSLKKQAISGAKWTTISTVILTICALLKVSILTRFLDKEDFGLMALISFVLAFSDLFADMGITTAILHKQSISKKELSSLYWFNLSFSLFLFAIIYLGSPLIASFYEEPELSYLIPLACVNLMLSGIGRQFKTILQKELKFKEIAFVDISAIISSLLLAVVLAIQNYGVLSLIYASLIQYFISNFVFFIIGLINSHNIKFYFSFSRIKPLLRIGIYQVGGQVTNYFNRDLDILIVGKFLGADTLGGYSLAKQLVLRPSQVINPILTRVASPLLAKYQLNISELKNNYLKLVKIVSTINLPIYLGLILFAPVVVQVLYGDGYEEINSIVRILCIYMFLRAISNPVGSLIVATGKTHIEFAWNMFLLIIFPLAIYLGSQINIEWVASSLVFTMILLFIPGWKILINGLISASLKEYVMSLIPDFKYLFKILKDGSRKSIKKRQISLDN
jgi:O-antigen/teichoic acid export membrane protein